LAAKGTDGIVLAAVLLALAIIAKPLFEEKLILALALLGRAHFVGVDNQRSGAEKVE